MTNGTTPLPGGLAPSAGGPPGLAPNSNGLAPNETPNRPPLSREDLEQVVAKLRDDAAKDRIKLKQFEDAARQQEQAAREAEEARLKQQGEFKSLAEKHESRVKELEPIATRYTALSELVSEQIKAETKDWPASVKALDPGKDAPIEERMAWKNRAAAIVAELASQARGTLPGNRPNPTPQGQPSREELVAANRKELQKSRTYGI